MYVAVPQDTDLSALLFQKGFSRHVNTSRSFPSHHWRSDGSGFPVQIAIRKCSGCPGISSRYSLSFFAQREIASSEACRSCLSLSRSANVIATVRVPALLLTKTDPPRIARGLVISSYWIGLTRMSSISTFATLFRLTPSKTIILATHFFVSSCSCDPESRKQRVRLPVRPDRHSLRFSHYRAWSRRACRNPHFDHLHRHS